MTVGKKRGVSSLPDRRRHTSSDVGPILVEALAEAIFVRKEITFEQFSQSIMKKGQMGEADKHAIRRKIEEKQVLIREQRKVRWECNFISYSVQSRAPTEQLTPYLTKNNGNYSPAYESSIFGTRRPHIIPGFSGSLSNCFIFFCWCL